MKNGIRNISSAVRARNAVNSAGTAGGIDKLLPLWPAEREDRSLAGRRRLVRTIERALRQERLRGRRGHWAYDLARHQQLARLWRAEAAELKRMEAAARHLSP